ncbi:M56 family metallopeptidase [Polyangium aurulentum]|uniref:M56 family metallopeptidase n=1 Tax=Polyangium aurulentum TaxID=2567896 RepID=UPI0010AEA315|nr:M56 family metallopeptidase [Polyangium aurulentum]UQA61236.1 hypothetical protein E8A73_012460 [Polyangium aurulentum]
MNTLVGWLGTYLIHSSVLLAGAWILDLALRDRPHWQELGWKVALVGGLFTATVQSAAGFAPWGGVLPLEGERATISMATAEPPPRVTEVVVHGSGGRGAVIVVSRGDEVAPVVAPPRRASSDKLARFMKKYSPVAVGLWAFGALALLGVLGRSWLSLRKRLEGRRRLEGDPIGDSLAALAAREPVMRAPLLSATEEVPVPMAFGLRRPEICLPERVTRELGIDAQESILAHELGHIARRDPAWQLLASIVCRAFFFQPLNWIAARRIAACAELLADDWAAQRTSRPLALAECLTKVARWVTSPLAGLPVPAMARGTSALRQRVERLVRGVGLAYSPRRPAWTGPVVGFVLIALTLIAPSACGVAEASGRPALTAATRKPGPTRPAMADADDDDDGDDDESICEDDRAHKDARRGPRHERRHRHHPPPPPPPRFTHMDADDDEDDEDDDSFAMGPGPIHIDMPDFDVKVDVNPQIDIDLSALEKNLEKSIPSPEQIEKQIQQAEEQAKRHGVDEETRKQIRRDLERARKEARQELEQAREELREHMRELRERLPEIRRQAAESARDRMREGRDAAREKIQRKHDEHMQKQQEKALRRAEKAREHAQSAREEAERAREGAEKANDDSDDDDDDN